MADNFLNLTGLSRFKQKIVELLGGKQDTLVSGTNIKTVNNYSLLGSGNIDIGGGGGDDVFIVEYDTTTYAEVQAAIEDNKILIANVGSSFISCALKTSRSTSRIQLYWAYNMNASLNDGSLILHVWNVSASNVWSKNTYTLAGKPYVDTAVATKQDTLVSGTNIKTINNESLLGSGNIDIQGGGTIDTAMSDSSENAVQNKVIKSYVDTGLSSKQDTLVSGTNIKTVGGSSLLGSGDIDVSIDEATETTTGTVKTNPDQAITLNANGQLEVGGRLGQFPTTTGIYAPNNREPRMVADYSFLVTDALGMNMTANRAMAVVSGYGMACKSAAAGATEYRVTNNYNNRILCKLAEGGFASRDEATSKAEQIVQVVSVTINGSSYTPDSAANDSTNDIVIKTSATLNPDSAITNIRLFGTMGAYATIHTGNGIKSESGGRNLLLGGGVTKAGSSNDNALVGNGIYSSGNGVAAFGRFHVLRKNRGFFAGTGHDSTNAPSEGASAVGQYSYMDAQTMFAVGNGSSQTARLNLFEVRTDGSVVMRSPNGTRYKLAVDDSGNLTTTAL